MLNTESSGVTYTPGTWSTSPTGYNNADSWISAGYAYLSTLNDSSSRKNIYKNTSNRIVPQSVSVLTCIKY